jgi:hypothetical protein
MTDKRTHFGRAGEYFAMSELLLRGWNVAVPVVDVGDDAFVIDDRDKTTRRVQVKTAMAEPMRAKGEGAERVCASFKLSRTQLRTRQPIELFYTTGRYSPKTRMYRRSSSSSRSGRCERDRARRMIVWRLSASR